MTPIDGSPAVQMIFITISYNLYYAVAIPMFSTANSSMVALPTRDSKSRGMLSTLFNAACVASAGVFASILILLPRSWLFVAGADLLGAGRAGELY